MTDQLSFTAAIATDVLVGRSGELEQIYNAVNPSIESQDQRQDFRCVLLRAEGGKGKTRMLREVCWQLGVPDDQAGQRRRERTWQVDHTIALPLIDLAEPRLHSVVPFLREVRRGFRGIAAISDDTTFREFDSALGEYDRVRDTGTAPRDISGPAGTGEPTKQIVDTFATAYAQLTQSFRVVWALDTMEQLFPSPPEIEFLLSELNITATDAGLTTYDWLINFVAGKPANTTMVLAGRLEPGNWAKDIERAQPDRQQAPRVRDLRNRLKRKLVVEGPLSLTTLVNHVDSDTAQVRGGKTLTIDLDDFDLNETRAYLRELRAQLAEEPAHSTVAEDLGAILDDETLPETLHLLTGGNPVRLALYIDLLVNVDAYPDELRYDLARLRNMTPTELDELRVGIDRALLDYLAQLLGKPAGQALEYLAITRRGLDRDRLQYIWGSKADDARAMLQYLRRLSFVKYRADGRYFLHDEFYTIYQRGFVQEAPDKLKAGREYRNGIFKKLIRLCEEQYGLLTNRIYDNTTKLQDVQLKLQALNEQADLQNERAVLKREIASDRRERQQLLAEQAHYHLYLDPFVGFKDVYFELVEQALSAMDLDLVAQFQSEIDLFFFGITADLNRRQAGLDPAEWDRLRFAVIYDRVTSWIRRLTRLGQYDQVKEFTEKALREYDELVPHEQAWVTTVRESADGRFLRDLARMEWEAYSYNAAILQGKAIPESIGRLQEIIRSLGTITSGDTRSFGPLQIDVPKLHKQLQNVRAHSLLAVGYGYTTLYQFERAEQNYSQADHILTDTSLDVLLARAKNDLSRVLGEMGAMDEALQLCDEGMRIRRELGFDYLRALSFNTMALIYNRNARQREALYHAEEALSLFRQLDNPRGIGLALLQAAEAQRRICNFEASEARRYGAAYKRDHSPKLAEAKTNLEEAQAIFAEKVKEEIRLIEVKIELASLYRDWAAIQRQKEGDDLFENAVRFFDQAIEIASRSNAEQYLLQARVSKAWLYKKCNLNEQAVQLAKDALASVPSQYRIGTAEFFGAAEVPDQMIFRHLSKIYSLLAGVPAETPEHFAEILEYHILAILYQQLFSPYESWFLRVNRRTLYSLMSKFKSRYPESALNVWLHVDEIVRANRLGEIRRSFDPLSFEAIIAEVFTKPERSNTGDLRSLGR